MKQDETRSACGWTSCSTYRGIFANASHHFCRPGRYRHGINVERRAGEAHCEPHAAVQGLSLGVVKLIYLGPPQRCGFLNGLLSREGVAAQPA